MAAAVACRRAALLHGHQQWPQRWAAAPCPRSISQLVKTNGRRAFLVDTLALVSQASGVSPYRTLAPFRLPPERCSAECSGELLTRAGMVVSLAGQEAGVAGRAHQAGGGDHLRHHGGPQRQPREHLRVLRLQGRDAEGKRLAFGIACMVVS